MGADVLRLRKWYACRRNLSKKFEDQAGIKMGKSKHPPPPTSTTQWKPVVDGGWGWMVVIGSFFVHVFADGIVYSFGVLLEVIMKDFGASNAKASAIISLLTGLTLGTGPIASAVTNKYGCRITCIIGSIIASMGCFASYYATSVEFLMVSVGCVMGFGFGLMYCPAIVVVTIYFEKKRAMATGIAVCGAGVGTVIFAPVSEFLVSSFSWRTVFVFYTGVVMMCSICGSLFRPLKFVEVRREDLKETQKFSDKPDKPIIKSAENGQPDDKFEMKKVEDSNKMRAAHSQMAMNVDDSERRLAKLRYRTRSMGESLPARTLSGSTGYIDVQDVFYWGSTSAFPQDREKTKEQVIPLDTSHLENAVEEIDHPKQKQNNKIHQMWSTFVKMMDMKLLLDPIFLLFAISNLLTSIAFNSPLVFLPAHAIRLGCTPTQAARVVSAFGLMNTVGRILFGLVSDRKLPFKYGKDTARNRFWIYVISMVICGTLTSFVFLFDSVYTLTLYSGLFGLTLSSYVCLTSVLLVDLVGIERLTNAFGLLLLFQGIGTVFGPPISGELADRTDSYDWSFVFCGLALIVSGVMLVVVPSLKRKAAKKATEKKADALLSSS
ncbi:hypothetical protein AB6A40_003396 [Gnathostoma spinigerum]|uniref:Major facilitator superfamily (MFS) profile domain-containing protein n=1 Tax=Gnathostoma spinigerum TaxID=75299 RepID=A0ABD6EJF2_9BILA